jgi:hypothetical protein
MTKLGEDAPSIESLEESFPFYPVSTLRAAIKAREHDDEMLPVVAAVNVGGMTVQPSFL